MGYEASADLGHPSTADEFRRTLQKFTRLVQGELCDDEESPDFFLIPVKRRDMALSDVDDESECEEEVGQRTFSGEDFVGGGEGLDPPGGNSEDAV